MTYRTLIGKSHIGTDFAYKVHLLYNCVCLRADRKYETVNADPELDTFEFDINTSPDMSIPGMESGHYILDSRYTPPAIMDKLLKQLYGSGSTRGVMPSADQLNNLIQTALHGFGHAPFGRAPFGRAP